MTDISQLVVFIFDSLEDIHKLANILRNKFDLECGVHKHTNGHRLYIFSSSKDKLLQLIGKSMISHSQNFDGPTVLTKFWGRKSTIF